MKEKMLKVGDTFGNLTICEFLGKIHSPKDNHYFYKVKCSCGSETIISGSRLKEKKTKSCKYCNYKKTGAKQIDNINLGDKFGKFTVVSNEGQIKKESSNHYYYKVRCECGAEEIVRGSLLKNNKKIMCRLCYAKNSKTYKHGKTNTRLFNIWQSMRDRCNCETSQAYKWYGGRGIKICNEWNNDFMTFYNWSINNGYSNDLSIDRIDVNGNYEPSNCRWADKITQANNRRKNRLITYNGETHTLAEWGRITGLNDYNLDNRINKYGWSIEKALTTPLMVLTKNHKKP